MPKVTTRGLALTNLATPDLGCQKPRLSHIEMTNFELAVDPNCQNAANNVSKQCRTSPKVVDIESRLVATTSALSLLNGGVGVKDGNRSTFDGRATKIGIGIWLTSRKANIDNVIHL